MNQTIRAIWQTRPVRFPSRTGSSAPVAGVCEGLGVRYQIDPAILRVFFVCTAFVGSGLFAYILCWILMPAYSEQPTPPQNERQMIIFGIIFSVIFLIPLPVSTSVTLIVMALIWWLMHLKQPNPPFAANPEPAEEPMVSTMSSATTTTDSMNRTPPAWDPLGVAPFAWDLPEPPPLVTVEKSKKRRHWPWIVIAGIIMAPILALTTALPFLATGVNNSFVGEIDLQVSNPDSLKSEYQLEIGDIHLNLRDLTQLPEDKTVEVSVSTGAIDIELPTNVPVNVQCSGGTSDISCAEGKSNPDAQGGTLNLKVKADIGSVKVQ